MVKEKEGEVEDLRREVKWKDCTKKKLHEKLSKSLKKSLNEQKYTAPQQKKRVVFDLIFGEPNYNRYYTVIFKRNGVKQAVCPYEVKKVLSQRQSGMLKSIKTASTNGFLIELSEPSEK